MGEILTFIGARTELPGELGVVRTLAIDAERAWEFWSDLSNDDVWSPQPWVSRRAGPDVWRSGFKAGPAAVTGIFRTRQTGPMEMEIQRTRSVHLFGFPIFAMQAIERRRIVAVGSDGASGARLSWTLTPSVPDLIIHLVRDRAMTGLVQCWESLSASLIDHDRTSRRDRLVARLAVLAHRRTEDAILDAIDVISQWPEEEREG